MKKGTALATALFALASFPLLAQQSTPATPPDSPAAQQNPPSAAPAPPSSPAATQATAVPVEFRPVNAELVSKLDSKTAKTGDNVVAQTTSSVKTADGTEIPKGSKLMGHVIAAQPSASGTNSQVALLFDHVEIKGGQSLAVHSQIQSIAPSGGAEPAGAASAGVPSGGAMSAPQTGSSANPSATGANAAARGAQEPQGANGNPAAGAGLPAAGTVVATNGNIAIRTTAIPGVLLANNAPGQQDPRMAQASSILLGAKRDIQLDGGTQMVVGVSAAGGGQ